MQLFWCYSYIRWLDHRNLGRAVAHGRRSSSSRPWPQDKGCGQQNGRHFRQTARAVATKTETSVVSALSSNSDFYLFRLIPSGGAPYPGDMQLLSVYPFTMRTWEPTFSFYRGLTVYNGNPSRYHDKMCGDTYGRNGMLTRRRVIISIFRGEIDNMLVYWIARLCWHECVLMSVLYISL